MFGLPLLARENSGPQMVTTKTQVFHHKATVHGWTCGGHVETGMKHGKSHVARGEPDLRIK